MSEGFLEHVLNVMWSPLVAVCCDWSKLEQHLMRLNIWTVVSHLFRRAAAWLWGLIPSLSNWWKTQKSKETNNLDGCVFQIPDLCFIIVRGSVLASERETLVSIPRWRRMLWTCSDMLQEHLSSCGGGAAGSTAPSAGHSAPLQLLLLLPLSPHSQSWWVIFHLRSRNDPEH